MQLIRFVIIIFLFFTAQVFISCNNNKNPKNFANVFKPLDGMWEGNFYIYEDTLGQRKGKAQPTEISEEYIRSLPLKLISVIKVKHIYTSLNPYLQKGKITDTYLNSNGNTTITHSSATNKIENGKLFCILNKPQEKIIHTGNYLGNNTIIWSRKILKPLKIEFFKEKVDSTKYIIVGWGYYGKDNPNLTPRTWFYGNYSKTN